MNTNGTVTTNAQAVIDLHLQVRRDDPEVFAALQHHPEPERSAYAMSALRIGVHSIQQASGSIDVENLKGFGGQLIAKMDGQINKYLDPKTGYLQTRLQQFVAKDGQLDAKFKQLIEGTLAEQLGIAFEEFVSQLKFDDEDSAAAKLIGRQDKAASQLIDRLEKKNQTMVEGFRLIIEKLQKSEQERLDKDVTPKLDQIVTRLATKDASQAERKKSPGHGEDFQYAVSEFAGEALGAYLGDGDNLEFVGNIPAKEGPRKGAKTGDILWTLGSNSSAPEARIIIEAKDEQKYTLRDAWAEIEVAREVREADFGVFVFSKACAPKGTLPFMRRGNDLIVVWDPEDWTTHVTLQMALSVARALVTRQQLESAKTDVDFSKLDDSIEHVEKAIESFGKIQTWAGTISNSAAKIIEESKNAKTDLEAQVNALNSNVAALKAQVYDQVA